MIAKYINPRNYQPYGAFRLWLTAWSGTWCLRGIYSGGQEVKLDTMTYMLYIQTFYCISTRFRSSWTCFAKIYIYHMCGNEVVQFSCLCSCWRICLFHCHIQYIEYVMDDSDILDVFTHSSNIWLVHKSDLSWYSVMYFLYMYNIFLERIGDPLA